jgi:hypothetical protein
VAWGEGRDRTFGGIVARRGDVETRDSVVGTCYVRVEVEVEAESYKPWTLVR